MAKKPGIVVLGLAWVTLWALIAAVLILQGNTAKHCVWINGVCFDRPGL
jgi:hypothetical protein